jgi:hypothetical protein
MLLRSIDEKTPHHIKSAFDCMQATHYWRFWCHTRGFAEMKDDTPAGHAVTPSWLTRPLPPAAAHAPVGIQLI